MNMWLWKPFYLVNDREKCWGFVTTVVVQAEFVDCSKEGHVPISDRPPMNQPFSTLGRIAVMTQ